MQKWFSFKGSEIKVSPNVAFTLGDHDHFKGGRTCCKYLKILTYKSCDRDSVSPPQTKKDRGAKVALYYMTALKRISAKFCQSPAMFSQLSESCSFAAEKSRT